MNENRDFYRNRCQQSRRIRAFVPHGLVAATVMAVVSQTTSGQISSYTYYEMVQSDLLSGGPPFVYDNKSGTDSGDLNGPGNATVAGQLTSFYQDHEVSSFIGSTFDVPGETMSMVADRTHGFSMRGNNENSLWQSTDTYIYGSTSFRDQVRFQVQSQGTAALASVEYVWNLSGLFTHIIDIPSSPQQRPLYRLHDGLRFTVAAGGAEVQPIDIQVDIYDPHATNLPTPPMWSVLEDDVSSIEESVPGIFGDTTFTVTLQQDGLGNAIPVDVEALLVIETRNRFLNDGPELNYYLQGNTRFNFANSADLLGIIVRDETGVIRTDVDVNSALGVDYILLPEPSSALMLAFALVPWPRRLRRGRKI